MANQELIVSHQQTAITRADDFMPVFDLELAVARRDQMVAFVKKIMREGVDYGVIPGTGKKPSLLKPGAEKLSTFFGLAPEFLLTESIEDWTGKNYNGEPFFYYRYKCRLTKNARLIGEGEGSSNSREEKYRWRWVTANNLPHDVDIDTLPKQDSTISEPAFAISKAETTGKYGKPKEYWERFVQAIASGEAKRTKRLKKNGEEMDAWEIPGTFYRIPNPNVADQVNTLQKMGQKRALVAAVLVGVNASEYFTQDVEDADHDDYGMTDEDTHTPEQRKVANNKLNDLRKNAPATKTAQLPPQLPIEQEFRRANAKRRGEMLADMRRGFAETFGDDGDIKFNDFLLKWGVEDPTDIKFKSLEPAVSCFMDMYRALEAAHQPPDNREDWIPTKEEMQQGVMQGAAYGSE